MAENIALCSCCKILHGRKGQRYCVKCHNAYMREWRKTHKLTGEARFKDVQRHKAGAYYRRIGIQESCEVSGCMAKSERHHDDYSKPLEIRWLCRIHHLELHNAIA